MSLLISTTNDLNSCFALRAEVFVKEQSVPVEMEQDADDAIATHLLATLDDQPVGTARLLRQDDCIKIGRVCVLPAQLQQGIGAALTKFALSHAKGQAGVKHAKLAAQVQVVEFYAKLGFKPIGAQYLEAGIAHQDMVLTF